MINKKLLFYIIIIFFSFTKVNAGIVNYGISEKYDEIFENRILSEKDVNNYQKIFKYQNDCKWKLANKYILKIDNQILFGHVLSQRYLHPKCYKSQYLELYYWMKKYSDLPQAKRIFRLAIKRMPKGYKSPTKPSNAKIEKNFTTISNVVKREKYSSSKKLTKSQKKEKRRLLNIIKSRVNDGWPSGALKILKQNNINELFDQVEIDQQKELIAKGYFLANHNDNPDINELAIKYADEALKESFEYVPYANWTAGLASWRLKRYEDAAKYFSNFSISLKEDEWHQASGSFWAARSYSKLNKYEEINFWFKRAASNPNSFYGLIANEILGIKNPIDWNKNKLEYSNESKIYKIPAVKRIMALIQVGLLDELEKEIIKINRVNNKDISMWSLDVAQYFDLAYTQLKIVGNLQKNGISLPIRYFYPTPIWQPLNGFRIEPALLYAFMHQESLFNASAKSYRGAIGLMQIMPSTAKFISSNKQVKRNNSNILKIPEINIDVGQEYIEYLLSLEQINNNLIYLTAAYNGGPGNLQKWQKNTNYLNDPLFFMESIPSRETRWFIEKVLTKYWIYNDKFRNENNSLKMIASGKDPIY